MKKLLVTILAVLMLASLMPVSAIDNATSDTVDIPVTKSWVGDNESMRPDSITLRLWNGSTEVQSTTITPDDNGNWAGKFTGVPKYDASGNVISYTVTEDAVENYEASVTNPIIGNMTATFGSVNTVSGDDIAYGNADNNLAVSYVNSLYYVWTRTTLTATQQTELLGLINAPGIFTVPLTADNTEFYSGYTMVYIRSTDGVASSVKVLNTLYEKPMAFGACTCVFGTLTMPRNAAVTNTRTIYTLEIPVVKNVEQGGLNAPVGDRTFYYTVTLHPYGTEPKSADDDAEPAAAVDLPTVSYSGALTASTEGESGDFKITVTGVDYAVGTIILTGTREQFNMLYSVGVAELPDGAGDDWVYESGDDFTWHALTQFTYNMNTYLYYPDHFTIYPPNPKDDGEVRNSMVFTNTYTNNDILPDTGSLTVSKDVSGTAASKSDEFGFTFTFTDKDGAALTGSSFSYSGTSDGTTVISGTVASGGVIKLRAGGSVTVTGLPVGTKYIVEESASDGYKATSEGASGTIDAAGCAAKFTNERNYISVSVTKQWNDNNSSTRPSSVTVMLYRDGKAYDSVVLSAENNWTKTWTGLYDGYEWTVDESVPSGYARQITQSGYNFTITNYIPTPQTGESGMIWVWVAIGVVAAGGIAWLIVSGRKKKGKDAK